MSNLWVHYTDYNKIGGLRDLAGKTPALEKIKNKWNSQQANGNLSSVHAYAFATDSWDDHFADIQLSESNGDMVVSVDSQMASGFYGIYAQLYTVTGKNRNTMGYSHTGITDQEPMINLVKETLGF